MTTTRFAQIEPTTRCNYSCGFCVGRSMRQMNISWDTFELFLLSHPGLEYVELQGEGEPLLHPRFFDMVAACRARGIRVSVITNGSLLGPGNVERLVQNDVDSVHVSLESADPDEFRLIRGGDFRKVVAGLRRLLGRRHQLGVDRPKVGFCVTVLHRTLEAIDQIIALYNDLQLDAGISVQPLQTMSCYTENYGPNILSEIVPKDSWRAYMQRFRAIMKNAGVPAGEPLCYQVLFADFDPRAGQCPWLERGTYLGSDGTVAGCCFIKNPSYAFGRIGQDSPQSIEAARRKLASSLRDGVVPAPCLGCGIADAVVRSRTVGTLSTTTVRARVPIQKLRTLEGPSSVPLSKEGQLSDGTAGATAGRATRVTKAAGTPRHIRIDA